MGCARGELEGGMFASVFLSSSEKNLVRSEADKAEQVMGLCRSDREFNIDQSALGERDREKV